jgi:hypothetical protein
MKHKTHIAKYYKEYIKLKKDACETGTDCVKIIKWQTRANLCYIIARFRVNKVASSYLENVLVITTRPPNGPSATLALMI